MKLFLFRDGSTGRRFVSSACSLSLSRSPPLPAAHLSLASLSLASHYLSLSHRQVDGAVVSSIGRGIFVLVGVAHGDGPADVDWVARKLLGQAVPLLLRSRLFFVRGGRGGGRPLLPLGLVRLGPPGRGDPLRLAVHAAGLAQEGHQARFQGRGGARGGRGDLRGAAGPRARGLQGARERQGRRVRGDDEGEERRKRERETEGTETRSSQRSLGFSKKEKTTKAQKFETFENRSRSSTTGP